MVNTKLERIWEKIQTRNEMIETVKNLEEGGTILLKADTGEWKKGCNNNTVIEWGFIEIRNDFTDLPKIEDPEELVKACILRMHP